MKTFFKILAVVIAGVASVMLIQLLIRKLHHWWTGDYISLYDEDEYIPHAHMTDMQEKFNK